MNYSYECEAQVNALIKKCQELPLDTMCLMIQRENQLYFHDFCIVGESKEDIDPSNTYVQTSLFGALCVFIKQNSIFDILDTSAKVIAARNIAALSQRKLAKKMEIDNANISRWENSEIIPKMENLIKIAEACEIDPRYLLLAQKIQTFSKV